MPIFEGKTKKITYEQSKFWIYTRLEGASFNPIKNEITPIPKVLENLEGSDGKKYSLAIVKELGQASVYKRYFNTEQNLYVYQQCIDLAGNPTWIEPNIPIATIEKHFWQPGEPIDTSTPIDTDSTVSLAQKTAIHEQLLIGNYGLAGITLDTIKSRCQSRSEYDACLKHFIEGTPIPQNASQVLLDELSIFKAHLTPVKFQKLPLNNARDYGGHIATAGEVFTYARDFFIDELKKGQPDYQAPPPQLPEQWNRLCSPGSSVPAALSIQKEVKELLEPIMAIYKHKPSSNSTNAVNLELKDSVTRDQLTAALTAIQQINQIDYRTPIGQCLTPFVIQICKSVNIPGLFSESGPEGLGSFRTTFLTTLKTAIEAKLPTLLIDANQPQATQFHALRVDQWTGGSRGASHADFVEFQKQHPNAILLIPDNFTDAALAPNQRHARVYNGKLAGQMRPQIIVGNSDPANPVYDLCTLGIPTDGSTLDLTRQQNTAKGYIAKLYSELRRGREIAVPQLLDENNHLVWAFGGGSFPHSPLSNFVCKELTKLQSFCNSTIRLDQLDQAYQDAWNNPQTPTLPLPKPELAPPAPAPAVDVPGMQATQHLTSAGFRQKFREWLESKNCQLVEEESEDHKTLYLRGTLPSGVGLVIHKDQIRLDTKGGNSLTDEEFRHSMSELIEMYKSAYHPGQVPPVRPLGNDAQKEIIRELLAEKGVTLIAKPTENRPENSVDEGSSARPSL